jgi:glycosyltransferase involved in cell wall biosynthesis
VLALSEYTKRDLMRYHGVPEDRISVVHAAAEPSWIERIRQTPRDRVEGRVLAVGNVLPRKNLLVVGQALRELKRRGSDVSLHVVGAVPPEGKQVAAELERLLGHNVAFTGYVDEQALLQAYRSADVFVFPSLYEGFGIPVLEAMAAGVPVVCSDASSLPEVVGDAALVARAEDVDAWTSAIARSLSDADVRGLLETRAAERLAQFSWDVSAAKVASVLRAAAGASSPAG